jgi:MerR family transcriptional regulator, light-induced transcriptional regulator
VQTQLKTLSPAGLQRFMSLRDAAIGVVAERFYLEHSASYERFGSAGRDACREDFAFHLDFLRPVLEFGLPQPMVDYMAWLNSVLTARALPTNCLVDSLDWVSEFFQEHLGPGDGRIIADALQAISAQYTADMGAPRASPQSPIPWPEAEAMEVALLAGDRRAAMALLVDCLDRGCHLVDFELHVIQPSLYSIGEKWQANQVTVAQEHLATATVHSVMSAGLLRAPTPKPRNKRVLLACVEGNNHAVGLRMVADAFQLEGYEVQHLGANVPSAALVQHALDWKPDIVGLSVSFPHQLRAAREVVVMLTERLGDEKPMVMIGGLAINSFTELSGVVGADATFVDSAAALACEGVLTTARAAP